ncbi:MAG TPA: hypothetical protein VFS67_23190 [Polyangiaceae bacterium]|nr:hypothetical protein [Polyangiaceae bacterium]
MHVGIGVAALAGVLLGLEAPALASGPLGANGQEITTSHYGIDLFQGPIYAGSRVTALGGAYVAVAWDVDGMLQNPAAPAVRPFFSVTDFDYWLGFGLTFPGSFEDMDFYNSGSKSPDSTSSVSSFVVATPSAMVQFGSFGFGVSLELQNFQLGEISAEGQSAHLSLAFNVAHVQMAYAFQRGALVLGMGTRILLMDAATRAPGQTRERPMRSMGSGLELGALWKPIGRIFSVGAAFRSGITTVPSFSDAAVLNAAGDAIFDTDSGQFYLPTQAILPWDLNVGVAVELGVNPENRPWVSDRSLAQREELRIQLRMLDHQDARDRALANAQTEQEIEAINASYEALLQEDQAQIDAAREAAYWRIQSYLAEAPFGHVLVSASALITGAAENAVGLESFLSQQVNRSGQDAVVSLRLGAEMGLIPNFMRLRAGTYLEPTRFETSSSRPHYTGGFDLRLGRWNVFGLWPDDYQWRLAVGADVARDYFTLGVTIAGWYPRHHGTVQLPGP